MVTIGLGDLPDIGLIKDGITLFRFASKGAAQEQTNGDINIIGNYSDAGLGVTDFSIWPTGEETYLIYRVNLEIRDSGTFDANKYGNNVDLTNGINVNVDGDGLPPGGINITPRPVYDNTDWGIYAGVDVSYQDYGTGDNSLLVRWTFAKSGMPMILRASKNQKVSIRVNDDLSDLIGHRFLFQGVRVGVEA